MMNTIAATTAAFPLATVAKIEAPSAVPAPPVAPAPEDRDESGRPLPGMAESIAQPLLWEHRSNDALTALMSANYASSSVAGRFKGLGAALFDQFARDPRGVSQAVRQSLPGTQLTPYGAIIAVPKEGLHGRGENQISFEVTTASGVHVRIQLDSQEDGLAAQMSIDGKLSDAERKALGGMASAFEGAVDALSAQPPHLRLSGLLEFDPKILASVDLHSQVHVNGAPDAVQTLDLHADAVQRQLSFSGPAARIDVTVDMGKFASMGARGGRTSAIEAYLEQFDQAAARGRADAAAIALFKDAFAEMHSDYGIKSGSPSGQFSAVHSTMALSAPAALSGAADFSASIKQTGLASNPMRENEKDTFSYTASQQTVMSGDGLAGGSISQRQLSHLTASYHLPSDGGVLNLSKDPASQSYEYQQLDETSARQTDLIYQQGQLVKATLNEDSSGTLRVMRYLLGRLISDVVSPHHETHHRSA